MMKITELGIDKLRATLSKTRAGRWKDPALQPREEAQAALKDCEFQPGSMRTGECSSVILSRRVFNRTLHLRRCACYMLCHLWL